MSETRNEAAEIGLWLRAGRAPATWIGSHAGEAIFQAMREISAQGRPVDLITVAEQLRKTGRLEEAGSFPYLTECWDAAGEDATGATDETSAT